MLTVTKLGPWEVGSIVKNIVKILYHIVKILKVPIPNSQLHLVRAKGQHYNILFVHLVDMMLVGNSRFNINNKVLHPQIAEW